MNFTSKITYSGNYQIFQTFETNLIQGISAEQCELKRSYGKVVKNITLQASFHPLEKDFLERFAKLQWSITKDPILHIFVTECSEIETYKTSVKDEIEAWLKMLQRSGCVDWMILVVETIDIRKTKNLLTNRTTVLDKIRLDFCSKNNCEDRCISILNPTKFEQKSTESFRCLLQRIRFLMLSSYNKNLVKYDDLVRCYREKRNQDSWNFLKYFQMQEDNALVQEKLQLHNEALAQYDEIESQFSQFVTNSSFGERSIWLKNFRGPISYFHGICLTRPNKFEMREKIFKGEVTILDFRNYIFERQAHLLLITESQAEVAERLLTFLFSTLREVDFIKLDSPEGALACWQFVCALEVLAFCDETAEPNDVCFQNCAPIWNLAKDKLYELGKLCGLLPGYTPTSEQLHIVVQLLAGIGEPQEFTENRRSHSPHRKPKKSAVTQLREALSSNQAFTKLYLELSELAISTYKHVSRLRSARLVGLDLGNFYCALNEPHKAVVFFTDLLRELKSENWNCLASQTLLELANCYRKMEDKISYTKTCSAISCCLDLEMLVRTFYFDEFLKSMKVLEEDESSKLCVLEDYFKILDVVVLNKEPIIQDDILTVELKLASNFPKEILADKVSFSFEMFSEIDDAKLPIRPATLINPINAKLRVFLHLDYKQDRNLSCASVACDTGKTTQTVRRTSSARRKQSPTTRLDFTNSVNADEIRVHPGINTIELKSKATRVGKWKLKQLSVVMKPLEFLSENSANFNCVPSASVRMVPFEITTKPASATLLFNDLIAGIEQPIQLQVSGGSFIFPADAKIGLKCSKNLKVALSDGGTFENHLNVPLLKFKSFEERRISLKVLTELPGRNIAKSIDHKILLSCPWSRHEIPIGLDFMPAITSSCRLHTCGTQKFLQVFLKGISEAHLWLMDARMKCDVEGVELVDLNPKSQNTQEIYKNLTVSYLWELKLKEGFTVDIIKVMFSTNYSDYENANEIMNYACAFDVMDYKTLFKIQAQLEPTELCRVRSVCSLNLRITKVEDNPFMDLMYEVLTDQNVWAVCGTASDASFFVMDLGITNHFIKAPIEEVTG
ncbi:TRAPPC10 family protein [Megaselia abdita]